MKRLCLILSICLTAMIGYAQDSNDELLKKLVEKEILTQQEADEIKKESTAQAKQSESVDKIDQAAAKVRGIFNSTPYLQIGGYGLFMYNYSNVNDVKHDAQARVVYISAKGDLGNNIRYFFLTELVNPMIYEFWGEWAPMKELSFRMGQFKAPYSLENQISLTDLETVFNTRSVSSLIGMGDDVQTYQNGKNNTGRDVGLMLSGSLFTLNNHDFIQYSAGVFQGTGLNTNDKDNSKDFSASLMFQPVNGFRVGGSVYFGDATYDISGNNIKENATNHTRNRWMLSADYKSDRLYARAEWLHGKDSKIDREGLYGTVKYYAVPKKVSLVGKVDYYNSNKDINSEVMDYTAGADYYFYKNCRFTVNYRYSDYSKKWDQKNSHSVIGQLQFVF